MRKLNQRKVKWIIREMKKKELSICKEVNAVMTLRKEHPVGAVNLEKILNAQGKHIPHSRIQKILREKGLAKPEPKKVERV